MFVVADAARFDTSRLQESRRERILRVADLFAAHLAEYLRNPSFITNDELPRRTQRIPFAQFALGRFRPFFKDAGRSYRRQVGSRQPNDRPAGIGTSVPFDTAANCGLVSVPCAADRFNPGHNKRFLPFNSLPRKDSSERQYELARTGHSLKEADALAGSRPRECRT